MWDLIIKNGRVLTMDSAKELNKAILIKDGLIADIVDNSIAEKLDARKVIDATGLLVMPGHRLPHLCNMLHKVFIIPLVSPKKWRQYQIFSTV